MEEITKYLQHKDFTITPESIKCFSSIGIENTNNYPLDYWKCKLQDNLIRERFNNDKLYLDPLFGLQDVSYLVTPNTLSNLKIISDTLCDGCYVAGGLLANVFTGFKEGVHIPQTNLKDRRHTMDNENSMTEIESVYNFIKTHHSMNDVDIFMTKDIDVVSELDKITDQLGEGAKTHTKTEFSISTYCSGRKITQFILRKYRSPNEIVYGFDIDASGLILVNGKVYATHCAKYAIHNVDIFFDPERSSPSYTKRLIKYGKKGYNVKVPQIDWNKVNYDMLNKIRINCRALWRTQYSVRKEINLDSFTILLLYLHFREDHSKFNVSPNSDYEAGIGSYMKDITDTYKITNFRGIIRVASTDRLANLSTCIGLMSNKHKEMMMYKVKDTDPMSQITGSFIPEVTSFKDYSNVDYIYGDGRKNEKVAIKGNFNRNDVDMYNIYVNFGGTRIVISHNKVYKDSDTITIEKDNPSIFIGDNKDCNLFTIIDSKLRQ